MEGAMHEMTQMQVWRGGLYRVLNLGVPTRLLLLALVKMRRTALIRHQILVLGHPGAGKEDAVPEMQVRVQETLHRCYININYNNPQVHAYLPDRLQNGASNLASLFSIAMVVLTVYESCLRLTWTAHS